MCSILEAVVDAVRGHRAVLSALGARTRKKSEVLAGAIPHILEGMRQEYVNRLIVLGAAGIDPDYGKYQNALTTMALWVAKNTVLKHPFVDQATQERLLAASEVDYTIVRTPRLMDGPFTGTYRVLPDALPLGRDPDQSCRRRRLYAAAAYRPALPSPGPLHRLRRRLEF